MSAPEDVWLRLGAGSPEDVLHFFDGEIIGETIVQEVVDSISLSEAVWLVSPVFLADSIALSDTVLRLIGEIEALDYSWAWVEHVEVPPSTPISGSSSPKQDRWLQILSKDYNWYWIIELTPILDVTVKEGGVRETSIVVDLPQYAEKNKPQYLGSEDDLLFLRIRGTLDSIRQIDYLNRNDYITLRIRSNGVTWWQGRVHLVEWQGNTRVSSENLVDIEATGRGVADDSARQVIGMFGDPPKQDKYLLILKKGHNWDWIEQLVEESEPVE